MKSILRYIENITEKREKYFSEAEHEIVKSNLRILKNCSFITILLLISFMVLAYTIIRDWRPSIPHIVFIPVSVAVFIVAYLYSKKKYPSKNSVNLLCVLYGFILFLFVILIDIYSNLKAPSCFTPLISIAVSSIFIFPNLFTDLMLTILHTVYIIIVLSFKDPYVAQYDVFSAIVALGVSIVVSHIIMMLRIQNHEIKMKYKELYNRDTMLSGIYNKQGFQDVFKKYIEQNNPAVRGSMFFLDLDDFKRFNDTYGHNFGDIILRCTSDVLIHVFRSDDIIGRWGGDEFIVFAEGLCDEKTVSEKCMSISKMLMSSSMDKSDISVSCSIGALLIDSKEIDFESVFCEADNAMYDAKAAGKGQYTLRLYPDKK